MDEIQISDGQMMRAFALWERRFRDQPREFMSDVERYTKYDHADIGTFSVEYFKKLLIEVR